MTDYQMPITSDRLRMLAYVYRREARGLPLLGNEDLLRPVIEEMEAKSAALLIVADILLALETVEVSF
ncbi:hypothetical protein OGR47_05080 [Methylocystis sp. MJC1]|jgi:hypothetical protein|uniref:hypothetical protein n=1 Tax=Methylocystis sp. MJC1 TaxID=2654282 RepID=UPI0013ECD06D|nr:hypothetical protein [Methylocystis sp. MJC1]KAF2989728.1 hypothetical protein MJC1_03073 [Methylocystis sp. MJC1]MBU6526383.1 hypothetical protein [Methylocystis sp. MJC1]UZX12830.1 hypothetical protein OGR47_05080 [Methylocystis sp. MJC1]